MLVSRDPCSRSQGNTAQDLSVTSGLQRCEALSSRRIRAAGAQIVRDRDQLVWIGALVAVSADGGGDGVDGRGSIAIHDARDVAEAVVGRLPRKSTSSGSAIEPGRITRDRVRVRYTEVQAIRQRVGELPLTGGCVEHPLLESSRGVLRWRGGGVEIRDGGARDTAAFIGDVERGGVRKPDAERETDAVLFLARTVGKPFRMHIL